MARLKLRHSTRRCYSNGCRLPECVAANTDYIRDYNQRRRAEELIEAVDTELSFIAGQDVPFPGAWAKRGACRNTPDVNFFPDGNGRDRAAKAVCATCPVSVICREFAIPHASLAGVWGGTNKTERDRIRLQRKATA